ncbi:MAG: AAA family ATPase [Nitrososphaeria archaeon]|nr:AAA family ATPase [Nitrososphaeria archaeon]
MCALFKDREKLTPRYIPANLPHRNDEVNFLNSFFRESLTYPSKSHLKTVQIVGAVGSGKTAVARLFGDRFESEARRQNVNLKNIYINLKLHGDSKVILYRHLTRQVAPEIYSTSLSAEELLYNLIKFLKEYRRYLVLTLDEIDYFIKRTQDSDIFYDMSRLEEFIEPGETSNFLGIIFIARGREFQKLLDEAALSSLGNIVLEFKPYTYNQLIDILEERVKEAFNPGTVPLEIIEFVADITSKPPVKGDVRYALDILLYSGNLAEYEGYDRILPEHVRKVVNITYPTITEEDIYYLPEKDKIVLLSIAKLLKNDRKPYTSLKEIRQSCAILCEQLKLKQMSTEEIENSVDDLHDRNIIEIKSLSSIGITGIPVEALDQFLENLMKRLESGLIERT